MGSAGALLDRIIAASLAFQGQPSSSSRLTAQDQSGLLDRILDMVEQTILPRRIVLSAPDGKTLGLVVVNRRIVAIDGATDEYPAVPSPDHAPPVDALAQLSAFVGTRTTLEIRWERFDDTHYGGVPPDPVPSDPMPRAAITVSHGMVTFAHGDAETRITLQSLADHVAAIHRAMQPGSGDSDREKVVVLETPAATYLILTTAARTYAACFDGALAQDHRRLLTLSRPALARPPAPET